MITVGHHVRRHIAVQTFSLGYRESVAADFCSSVGSIAFDTVCITNIIGYLESVLALLAKWCSHLATEV